VLPLLRLLDQKLIKKVELKAQLKVDKIKEHKNLFFKNMKNWIKI